MVGGLVVLAALGASVALARREFRGLRALASRRVHYEPLAITAEGSQVIGRLADGRSVIVNGYSRSWLRTRMGEIRPDGDFSLAPGPEDRWHCVLRYDDGHDPVLAVLDFDAKLPHDPGPPG